MVTGQLSLHASKGNWNLILFYFFLEPDFRGRDEKEFSGKGPTIVDLWSPDSLSFK